MEVDALRVVVAMSGGVDSSVAAALLRRQGHDVVGVTMQIWPDEGPLVRERRGGCCGMGAVRDARAVAALLDIPHYVLQMREAFERLVIARFAATYAAGRTPNPCIACNEHIKFAALVDKARGLGADALATGHYARLCRGPDGRLRLRRAADRCKDQSYVLYPLPREELGFFRFPLGELEKPRTRALARELGLPVADKPDSQEICFVGEQGHADLVTARHPEAGRPGPIVDLNGTVIGRHRGLAHYTVGQRRGLGLTGREPRYVVAVDAERNTLVVGGAADTSAVACRMAEVRWLLDPPADGTRVTAKVRAGPAEHAARVFEDDGGGWRVLFDDPVRAVTPGQACVLYRGDDVLGGGEIDRVERASRAAAGAVPGR